MLKIETIYNFIKENPNSCYDFISNKTGFNRRIVCNSCAALVKQGKLTRDSKHYGDIRFTVKDEYQGKRSLNTEYYSNISIQRYTAEILVLVSGLFRKEDSCYENDDIIRLTKLPKSTAMRAVSILRSRGILYSEVKDSKSIYIKRNPSVKTEVEFRGGRVVFDIKRDYYSVILCNAGIQP